MMKNLVLAGWICCWTSLPAVWAQDTSPVLPQTETHSLQMKPLEKNQLLMLRVIDNTQELKSWMWIGLRGQTEQGSYLRLVEVDLSDFKPKSKHFDQYDVQGATVRFVNHERKYIVLYPMKDAATAETCLDWRVPQDWLENTKGASQLATLGTKRRQDGRLATVQVSRMQQLEDRQTVSGVRIASFTRRPKVGDLPLVKEIELIPDGQEAMSEVRAFLMRDAPSESNYSIRQAIIGAH